MGQNIKKKILAIAVLFTINFGAQAQKALEIDVQQIVEKLSNKSDAFSADQFFYIAAWQQQIPSISGVSIVRQLHSKVAIVTIENETAFSKLHKQANLTGAIVEWKCTPATVAILNQKTNTLISFVVGTNDVEIFFKQLQTIAAKKISIQHVDNASQSVVLQCTAEFFRHYILPMRAVVFADVLQQAKTEANIIGYNRSLHGINAVDYTLNGANGKGIVVGIKEQKMEETDLDIFKRILPSSIASANVTQHATVIASIVGGAGNIFYSGRGIANHCSFFSSSFANLFPDDANILAAKKVTVQNHSYGTIVESFYGAEALSYDAQCKALPTLLHIFSSGNRGSSNATSGTYANIPGFANITGNFKMAKNVLTVGGINIRGEVQPESSGGPMYDGRLAPQLVALGPNGTSDAAAIVSGTAAVLQQVYADSNNGVTPPASLVKAILYNTADDVLTAGIDYKSGFGMLNSLEATKAIMQKKYDEGMLATSSSIFEKQIQVPAQTAQLKITLAWTDSASALSNLTALVNDLDLELISTANGQIFRPWILNTFPHADSLSKPAVTGRDSLNTAEQIAIINPQAGAYIIRVKTKKMQGAPQVFHVAHQMEAANQFEFTNPIHTSDVNRFDNAELNIKWRCFPADTNALGRLFITFNNGQDWIALTNSIKLNQGNFEWLIKDTSVAAQLKMETDFGSYFSRPFIIHDVLQVRVAYNCNDSAKLFWKKHVYATAYRIYNATDSPFLKLVNTVTDTAVVLQKAAHPTTIFAVEPVLSNAIPAARSVAVNINLQGVQCFYKALNYQLLDGNALLMKLELSDWMQVDSVFFEKVNATGVLIKTYCAKNVLPNQLFYTCEESKLDFGQTKFRARIKLKNSATIYTEIISVITSGAEPIVFYPNPVSRNASLKFVLKQGIPYDSRLQIIDAQGRLYKNYASLPNEISTWNWPAGIYFYRLINDKHERIGSGRIWVQ